MVHLRGIGGVGSIWVVFVDGDATTAGAVDVDLGRILVRTVRPAEVAHRVTAGADVRLGRLVDRLAL